MTDSVQTAILKVCEGDAEFYRELCVQGVVPTGAEQLGQEHVEAARVAYVLVRELDVNWAGVEVVLRMRRELVESRKQIAELLELLRSQSAP